MLTSYISEQEITFVVYCHDSTFKHVTVTDSKGQPMFHVNGTTTGTSWSWRRKVYDSSSDHVLFDFRHHNIDIKNGWVVESPTGRKLCSLVHKAQITTKHSAIDATVHTESGEQVLVLMRPNDLGALIVTISVGGTAIATIRKVEANDRVIRGKRNRSVWEVRVASGVDLSLVMVMVLCRAEMGHRLRLSLLPFFLIFAAFSFTESKHFFGIAPSITSLWAQSVVLNIVHVTSLLFIEKWPAPVGDPKNPSWSAAVRTTYQFWGNPQLLPQAKQSTIGRSDKTESLAVFLTLRISKLPIYYYVHWHVMPRFFAETLVNLVSEDVAQTALLTRLSEVTAREALVRSYMAVSWIWESVVFLDGANAALAVLSVLIGLDKPGDWPPLFGGPGCAYGLRSFWSRFWHLLAVRPYTNYGRVIARAIGLLRPGSSSAVPGIVVAFVAFLLSGLSHAAVSWRLGMRDWLDCSIWQREQDARTI
ncbi:hypothetical protein DL764_001555 [Monosporascus ibericus]|uniref:Wax synthase domain-containing protein n=1 Tax=Monosporascus ibericus TaxID=155417 RepID=A0A4Q4TSH6_9PEZI|nr:hypothetical protein DL764_001555 [Monosporascus ibericus]